MAKKTKKNKVDRYIDALHQIDGKLVIITGANSGLGFEMAKTALIKGAHVVMACRNQNRAEQAKERLINETGSHNVEIFIYDQSDFKSVSNFANAIKNQYSHFYALILNAGLFHPNEVVDEYHVSTVYRTNFLGAYELLKELKDYLGAVQEEKRIIIQGSVASFIKKYKNKDNFIYGKDKPFKQYSLSKLCCSNLHIYYRDNNTNPNVKYLLCEPGASSTGLFNSAPKWFKSAAIGFMKVFGNDAKEGSLSGCKLMCDVCANGDYYRPGHLFTAKGLPKMGKYPDKYIVPNIISDAEEALKQYVN